MAENCLLGVNQQSHNLSHFFCILFIKEIRKQSVGTVQQVIIQTTSMLN